MMTISTQTRGLRGSTTGALTTKRRQAGTSLVEILVVIVIFLIGILAVIQVFPGGFRLLLTSRSNSVATQLGRAEIERIKANPDLLPEQVLAVRYVGGVAQEDRNIDPLSFGPLGDSIDQNGSLTNGGADPQYWAYASGPNVARRIIGEGQRVPITRTVGSDSGGLMILDHGPIDPGPSSSVNYPNIVAYGNDLSRNSGLPRDAVADDPTSGWNVTVPGYSSVGGVKWVSTPVSTAPYEYFLIDASNNNAGLLLPTGTHDRLYRVRVSATIGVAGSFTRVNYISLSVFVPAMPTPLALRTYPLVLVNIERLLTASGPNVLPAGGTVASVETDTVRVAPRYIPRTAAGWSGDAFEVKVLNPNLGVLLFSPAAREGVVSRPGGVTEPLVAKVDYDVLDWRILHDDFRLNGIDQTQTMQLALQSLKVGGNAGPDGRPNGYIPNLETANSPTDNVVVVDVATGGIVREIPGEVKVDKSRGTVTIDSPTKTITIDIPTGLSTPPVTLSGVSLANRSLRVLYRARNEWSVQLVKGAAQYTVVNDVPTTGACYIGGGASGGLQTRLYFPKSEAGRKVTIDKLAYYDGGGNLHVLEGQDFQIQYQKIDSLNLPCISLGDVVSNADHFSGYAPNEFMPAVTGVKSASLMVRVLWNPDAFTFTSDPQTNLDQVNIFNRGWRKSATETYLRAEESR